MNSTHVFGALALAGALFAAACTSGGTGDSNVRSERTNSTRWPTLAAVPAPRGDVVDELHGVRVGDPYRWLENSDAPATQAWIAAQNVRTRAALDALPTREALTERLTELWNYERYGLPERHGLRWFVARNDGLQNQAVLHQLDPQSGELTVLLDPNTLSSDGTMALASYRFSRDGRYLAYGIADGGSDWMTWRVRDVTTGQDLADTLRWIKFSVPAWSPDSSGLYYSRYDAPRAGAELEEANFDQKLCFHRLGTAQEQDELVLARPDHREWSFAPEISEDGRWLIVSIGLGTDPRNLVFVEDRAREGVEFVELVSEFEASFDFVESHGGKLWFVTNLDAPRARLVSVDLDLPRGGNPIEWATVVPQSDDKLDFVSLVGGRFLCGYTKDARTAVRVHALDGEFVRDVALPGVGDASGFGGDGDVPLTYYSFASFRLPATVYSYDIATGESRVWRAPKLAFDPDDYETEQVFYPSKDGTRVPMFLTYKRGLERDGNNPTWLYAYGGFDVTLTPNFRASRIAWLERGGIYAQANLRGGGEYGEEWHAAGTKLRKQNVFDDFIAAAEFLVREKWTSPRRLAIQGGSNGGLLVGAVLNQRPELFGAALPAVGVMDMLRFELFTIGWAWASDYGSVKNADEFAALYAYSPYHNVKLGAHYPATMVETADRDDRVVPAHSFKYAAALQHAQGGSAPILIRIDTRSGHGAGKPTAKQIEQAADELAFALHALGVD